VFAITFMGHQGWLFRSERAAILVDPLLREEFGDAHALDYRVWPPRELDLAAFPALDGVVLTHEHDDHFDLPSLARLDRAIPIHLSARSSTAAHQILREMGFTVHALVPGKPIAFGELEVLPFAGDHVAVDCGDEWDALPFVVRHTGGAGSFFSMVDITLTQRHVEWAAARIARPGVLGWTNNALDWSHMAEYLAAKTEGTQQCFVKMGMGHKLVEQIWGAPQAMVMCAGGFAFHGEREHLNARVFCVDNDAVCAAMSNVYKKEKFVAARPGQTLHLVAGKLKSIDERTPFLGTVPRNEWPSRGNRPASPAPDYAPATGRRALGDDELARLRADLDEFAGSLVGGRLFASVHSLDATVAPDRELTFAFVLRRDPGAPLVFAYVPSACAFEEASAADPRARYVAGVECWASDLAAILRGELGPIALLFGRAAVWNAAPQRFDFDPFAALHRASHPLRRPREYLATYRRLLAACADVAPVVARAAR
jgi:L-ascorbate metabolism protein UlaG (beta-lactamase superfamily)